MVYCVEDDKSIRELIIYALNSNGYEAYGFSDGKSFFEALEQKKPNLILLDIMLPGQDGIEILKKIKSSSKAHHIPVIMLTAKSTEYDKVIGLDTGADDYITKPFGIMEFLSRVRAVLRRYGHINNVDKLTAGNLIMYVDKHIVLLDGKEINLTYKEFELLKYLMENSGIALSRDKILVEG